MKAMQLSLFSEIESTTEQIAEYEDTPCNHIDAFILREHIKDNSGNTKKERYVKCNYCGFKQGYDAWSRSRLHLGWWKVEECEKIILPNHKNIVDAKIKEMYSQGWRLTINVQASESGEEWLLFFKREVSIFDGKPVPRNIPTVILGSAIRLPEVPRP